MFKYGLISEEKKILLENSSLMMGYNHNYDDAGLILRTGQGLYICLVENKKLDVVPYSDFLAVGNKRYLKIRFKDNMKELAEEKQGKFKKKENINKSEFTEFLEILKSRYLLNFL
jgi:hypothetical protein